MAGRHRRKVSSSTVATIDTPRTRWLKESDILKPIPEEDRPIAKSGKWPTYVLTDATVHLKDGKRPANPLLPNQPWVVRGKLEVDPKEQGDMLLDQNVTSGYIEIPNSTMYSISWGPLAIWVNGERGWFEIVSPSPQFAEIFKQMQEAITLYYAILESLENLKAEWEAYHAAPKNKRKRMQKPSVTLDDVLLKYAVSVGDGMFRDEAEERCHKWAPFMINHFPKETDIEWKGTFFYTWIIDKHPDVYKDHLKRVADEEKRAAENERKLKAAGLKAWPSVEDTKPTSRASSVRSQGRTSRSRIQSVDTDLDMKDVSPARSSPATRPSAKHRESPGATSHSIPLRSAQGAPQAAHPVSTAARDQRRPDGGVVSPIDALVEALEEIAADTKGGPAALTNRRAATQLYTNHKIKSTEYHAGSEILAFFSRALVRRLDARWHTSQLFAWLQEQAKKPSIKLVLTSEEKIPHQLVPRDKKPRPSLPILPSKPVLKSKGFSSDNEDSDEDDSSGHPRHAGKGGLRLQSASKKRMASDMLDGDESAGSGRRARKAAKTTNYYDIPHLPLDDDESDDNDDANADAASPHTSTTNDEGDQDGLAMAPPKDAVRVVVHAEKLPSMSPTGPNGTWVCDQENCGYVVRAAEEAAGRALVQQHFRDHELSSQKVALVLTEAERGGGSSINHLLERLQKMRKDTAPRAMINGEEVPKPIKRRLIV